MGMPGWAMALGAPFAAEKLVVDPISSVYGMYKGIRDDQADQGDKQATMELLQRFANDPNTPIDGKMLSKFANPAAAESAITHAAGIAKGMMAQQAQQASPVLDKFATDYSAMAGPDKRFFVDPASVEVMRQQGLQIPDGTNNASIRKGLQDFRQQGQLESDMGDMLSNPGDVNALARIASNPLAQAQHNILSTIQTAQDKAATRADAQAKQDREIGKVQSVSDFQSAIGGLTGPSKSPAGLAQFAQRGGYESFPGVEADIRQAAADYNVGDSPEVNKAITDARDTYKNTFLPPQTVQVGRTTASGQTNLLGDFRKDVTSTAPVVNVKVNQSTPNQVDSDAQAVLAYTLAPKNLGKRSGHDAKVREAVRAINPDFDFVKADANASYVQSPANLSSRALIQGVEPLYGKLLEAGKSLGNSSLPGVNRIVNWVKEETGNPEIVAFNNLRDDVIAESERVLLGSGVLSDSKYLRAVKNVSSAGSMPQLKAAVGQLRTTVKARLEALDKQPYPAQRPPLSSFGGK